MYILKQGNLIVYAAKTEEEINSVKEYMPYDEIIETEDTYVLENGVYLTENEALFKAKEQKHAENTQKAKQAVENGYVTFKEAKFETNAQTVGDLTATMLMLQTQQNNRHSESDNIFEGEESQNLEDISTSPQYGDTNVMFSVSETSDETDSSVVSLPQNDNKNSHSEQSEESETDISGDALNMTKLVNENGEYNSQFSTSNSQLTNDNIDSSPAVQNDDICYTWLSKDDKAVELILEDFITLGNLIAEFKNTIWSNKYLSFKTQIENAQTIEELENIDIDYFS